MLMNKVDGAWSYDAMKLVFNKCGFFIASRPPSLDKEIPDYASWETPPDDAFFAGASKIDCSFGRIRDLGFNTTDSGNEDDPNATVSSSTPASSAKPRNSTMGSLGSQRSPSPSSASGISLQGTATRLEIEEGFEKLRSSLSADRNDSGDSVFSSKSFT